MAEEENKDFVDELMDRAFRLPLAAMPDFSAIRREDENNSVTELDEEELAMLAAAGIPHCDNLSQQHQQELPPSKGRLWK